MTVGNENNINKARHIETTAMGAAYLAGLAVGFWKDIAEIKKIYQIEKEYKPTMKKEKALTLYKGWQEHVIEQLLLNNIRINRKK